MLDIISAISEQIKIKKSGGAWVSTFGLAHEPVREFERKRRGVQ